MSRTFMFGVLAILVVLLGVMANVVGPKSPKEPDPDVMKKEAESRQKAQAEEIKTRQKMMVTMMKRRKEDAAKASHTARAKPATGRPSSGMEISSDWFKKRKDGTQGLAALEATPQVGSTAAIAPSPHGPPLAP
jgi:Na+-transporting methylmalonyl-CoA/oxaloacetate decarboxylase gamma subunit